MGSMVDTEKQLQDLKKEIVEARNLVIKNDNILKNLHADLKGLVEKQKASERRAMWTSATAYLLFVALAALGAFKFASAEIREKSESALTEKAAREKAESALKENEKVLAEATAESVEAMKIFDALSGNDESKKSKAIAEIAAMKPKYLSELEQRALKDKSLSLRIAAAQNAFDNGRSAVNRRDYRTAKEELNQYLNLAAKPEDSAYFMLGQALHGLREWKDSAEALRIYLKGSPSSKSAEFATMLLGEALTYAGQAKEAIEVYRNGGNRFGMSAAAQAMRTRARRLEQDLKGEKPGAASKPEAAAEPAPQ
jgi:TolA-binding protein